MKAVIVDIDENKAVVLRDDGRFEQVRNHGYSVGQEIEFRERTVSFPRRAAVAASAAVILAAGAGMGAYAWRDPVSYVSLDINPSIAYSLNEFNRVISVKGMNDEGAAVVDAIGGSLKNRDLASALTITVEHLSADDYMDAENANYMVIGVYSDKDAKADALMSTVDAFSASTDEACSVTTVNVSKETKESADSYGISCGRMELINEIANVASDPDEVDPAALASLTVAELKETKAAAASGASVAEAVAAATPASDEHDAESEPGGKDSQAIDADSEKGKESGKDGKDGVESLQPKPDSDAVASDSKPADGVDATSTIKGEDSASADKGSAAGSGTNADDAGIVPAASEGGGQGTSGSDTVSNGAGSGIAAGSGSETETGGKSGEDASSKNDGQETEDGDQGEASDDGESTESTTSPEKGESGSSSSKEETSSSVEKGDAGKDDATAQDIQDAGPEDTDGGDAHLNGETSGSGDTATGAAIDSGIK